MLGLMYLVAVALYLALMFLAVRWAWRKGKANGSTLKAAGLASIAFLAVYLPVFWNWVPTAVTFHQMCANDAGFSASVEPMEWIAKHRGEFERLRGVDPNLSTDSVETPGGYWRSTFVGGLLATETKATKSTHWGMPFLRYEMRVSDASTGQVLARAVNYSLGSREDARIWLTRQSCFDESHHPVSQLTTYKSELKGALK